VPPWDEKVIALMGPACEVRVLTSVDGSSAAVDGLLMLGEMRDHAAARRASTGRVPMFLGSILACR